METKVSKVVTDHDVLGWIQQSGIELDIQEPDFAVPLTQLGVDSLSLFEIVDLIEENTGLVVDDSDFKKLVSIQAMGQFIRERLNS